MTKIRCFSESGIDAVRAAIELHTSELSKGSHGVPISEVELEEIVQLAKNEQLLDAPFSDFEIDPMQQFNSSYALGKYLCTQFGPVEMSQQAIGVWAWLAITYLRQLLSKNKDGKRLLASSYRYVPDPNNRLRYYRHLVSMPYYLVQRLGKHSYIYLYSPPYESGDFLGQAQKDEFVSNVNVLDMCEKYYFDKSSKRFSPGFTLKDSDPRSMRRLVQAIIPQLSVNYDTRIIGPDEIFELLPADFQAYALKK